MRGSWSSFSGLQKILLGSNVNCWRGRRWHLTKCLALPTIPSIPWHIIHAHRSLAFVLHRPLDRAETGKTKQCFIGVVEPADEQPFV